MLQDITLLPWPANSPDMNPIENVWGFIKKKLDGQTFNSKDECFAAIEKHWFNFYEEHSQKLAETMPGRIQCLIKNKGWQVAH